MCNELLAVAESIEPGASLFRGKILLDLQDAQKHQTMRQFESKDISAVVAHVNLSHIPSSLKNYHKINTILCFSFVIQEQFNEQMDVLNEASSIFGSDAILKPILQGRMKQINANIQQLKLPR